LILAGYGPNSVFSVTPAPTGGDAVAWFSPLLPIGAIMYWFVRRVRMPVASLIVGFVLATLSGLSLINVLIGLPVSDKDGMLYMIQFWQFAFVLWIVVGVSVGISKERDRRALGTPVRPDQPPPDMPLPGAPVAERPRRDLRGLFIKSVVAAGVVVLILYIWAATQIEF
jgi:hypothetical protein